MSNVLNASVPVLGVGPDAPTSMKLLLGVQGEIGG